MKNQTAILLGVAAVGLIVLSRILEQQGRWSDVISGSGTTHPYVDPSGMFGMDATSRAYWYNRARRHYHH